MADLSMASILGGRSFMSVQPMLFTRVLFLIIGGWLSLGAASPLYWVQNVSGAQVPTHKIECQIEGVEAGSVQVAQINRDLFVIHSLYVEPSYRSHGYGAALCDLAAEQAQKQGARRVLLQPGPFERKGEDFIGVDDENQLAHLVQFYKKHGFKTAPLSYRLIAKGVYWFQDIHENPWVLMDKQFEAEMK